jgi:hypothetical protein
MADFCKSTVTDGLGRTVEIITSGDPHCVLSVSTPDAARGKYAAAHIKCACGLVFTHTHTIEAAKAWKEHHTVRNKRMVDVTTTADTTPQHIEVPS